jgi:N utilization substance protein B
MMMTETGPTSSGRTDRGSTGVHAPEREGRHLALAAVFEAEFGQRTANSALLRRLEDTESSVRAATHATRIVEAVVAFRDSLDARLEEVAPAYPVVQLARIDRALLRCGMGELLHCPTTPGRVAIAEWVELARTYSGEPVRRLMNGALGRVAKDAAEARGGDGPGQDHGASIPNLTIGLTEGPAE